MDINMCNTKVFTCFKIVWQISIILMIFISSPDGISSYYALTSEKMSGLYNISIDSTDISNEFINTIDSIQILKRGEGFKWPVKVSEVYGFKRFPSLRLVHLDDEDAIMNSDGVMFASKYEIILLNTANNAYYIIGDSSDLFSKALINVIDPSLSDVALLDLVTLYFNMYHNGGSFYLMNSIEDFDNLFVNNRIHQPTPYAYTVKDRVDDTNIAINIIRPAQIERHNNYSIVRLYYWDAATGNLVFCELAIVIGNIIPFNQEIKASRLGPYFQDPLLSPKHPLGEKYK